MNVKLLDRYIVKELVLPFCFGVAIFSTLFIASGLLFQIARMIVQQGVSLFLVAKYFLAKIPSTILYAFPMATLLATLLAFGRLSNDNEVVALRAGGVSFTRIALPALLFALSVTLVAIFMNDQVVPRTNFLANTTLETEIRRRGKKTLQNLALTSTAAQQGVSRMILAKRLEEESETMEGAVIWDSVEHGEGERRTVETVRTITAERAKWIEGKWRFFDGTIVEYDRQQVKYTAVYKSMEVDIKESPSQIADQHRAPEEMARAEIRKKIAALSKFGSDIKRDITNLNLEYHQKVSIPCASFIFAFIGIPYGMRPHRSSSSVGLGLSMIFIFIYYIILFFGIILGQENRLPAFIAAWLPNIVFLIFGGYRIATVSR